MAEEAFNDNLEKTEEPTPKRREEARGKGQFPRSKYLIPAVTLGAIAVALRFGGEELMVRLQRCVVGFFAEAGKMKPLASEDLLELSVQAALLFAPILLPVFAGVTLLALGAGFMQSGFVLASEPVRVDFGRVNPFAGFRRLLSIDTFSESVKALVVICVLGLLGGVALYTDLPALISLSGLGVEDIYFYASHEVAKLIAWIIGAVAALAGLDYLYQRWRTDAQLRMTRQEVKEELREQEGDPHVKGHLKSLRQKLTRRRMTAEVAKADVIITNPTHLAVALRYRVGEMSAPKVLGKGAGFIAEKIREIARQKGIPIVENKPLARMLYNQVEVGREVPEALYRAVAEVLAYVYRLRRSNRVSPVTSEAKV
ncbi:MAG TPA: flagellar biosynthesis protein FlhB [Terriglobales bacterium]|jgi:flagellar biosynthetic protein FlhB|nr:flagellar biosynthesis protein FlhB [Terriglobales bacterium]